MIKWIMDLSLLIPSKIRRQVLEYFVFNPRAQIHVNGLARVLKAAPQPVYRELINLENWGLLKSFKRGNQRAFYLNQRFVFLEPIEEIFRRREKILSRPPMVTKIYDWQDLARQYDAVAVPAALSRDLERRRQKPRSYEEEILLGKKDLL